MIPKTIHYCWFGNAKKNRLIKNCIQSWQKELPAYKIKCWDETNSPLGHPFVEQAFKEKKWAFVADYVRLHALYTEGGIYFDTDVLVLKNFDDLCNHDAFIGFEDEVKLNAAVVGAKKGHHFIEACLREYDLISFNTKNTIPLIVTKVAKDYGNLVLNKRQTLRDVEIFPTSYFYPYPYKESFTGKDFHSFVQPETYSVHLWDVSWADNRELRLLKQGRWLEYSRAYFKDPIRSLSYYKKAYNHLIDHFSGK